MTLKYVLAAALVVGFAGAALPPTPASSSSSRMNKHCRVVEKNVVTEDQLAMQVGKQAYPSMDEANIDLKVVCDNS